MAKRKNLGRDIKRYSVCYFMVAPYILLFLFFILAPIIIAFFFSFTDFNMVKFPPDFSGLDNYIRIFLEDDDFLIAIRNTLVLACVTGPISYFACLFLAWFINELHPFLRAFFTVCFYAPTISGTLYVMWGFLFSGDQYGILNNVLMDLGILSEPYQWLTNTESMLPIIMVVQIWMSFGSAFLSFVAGLQGIPRSLYEAGSVDGVRNRWQELFYLTLPSMGPQLLFGAVMQIAGAFSIGATITALMGYPTTDNAALTVVTYISDFGSIRYEMGYACALSFILFVIILATHWVIEHIIMKYASD
ncbi:MAG: sugar ABC transporter permease [Clostridia bacterium]|nr:sugar ABC transporter permease [Clostridia bacterium]